jgi:hypothetical protein
MMWRLYTWPNLEGTLEDWIPGLDEILNRLHTRDTDVTAYSIQRGSNGSRALPPTDRESITAIWSHGIKDLEKLATGESTRRLC